MSYPTYPKSGQVGDFVGGLYQDLIQGVGICTKHFGINVSAISVHINKDPYILIPYAIIGGI
jgi:hypothetical protein